jgi:colicin import membrane protein
VYLFLRQYSLPLLLAMILHAAAGWALYSGWTPEREVLVTFKPRAIMATLIQLESKAKPAPKPTQRPMPKPQTKVTPVKEPAKPDPEIAQRKQAALEAAKRVAQKAAEEQARQQRLARLSELAQTSLDQAISSETESLQTGSEELVAQSFRLGIYELVRQNWSRPPSARNGMKAKLLVELIPTGEVVSVALVESSGNTAFDRSAERAVRTARRFDVPSENAIFESHFRRFYFLFQPEDLLR